MTVEKLGVSLLCAVEEVFDTVLELILLLGWYEVNPLALVRLPRNFKNMLLIC